MGVGRLFQGVLWPGGLAQGEALRQQTERLSKRLQRLEELGGAPPKFVQCRARHGGSRHFQRCHNDGHCEKGYMSELLQFPRVLW